LESQRRKENDTKGSKLAGGVLGEETGETGKGEGLKDLKSPAEVID
jgi:hypothetical protein